MTHDTASRRRCAATATLTMNMCPHILLPRPTRRTASHWRSCPSRRGSSGRVSPLGPRKTAYSTACCTAESEQRRGGAHRRACSAAHPSKGHAWDGRGGQTQTFATATGQFPVRAPPRQRQRLVAGECIAACMTQRVGRGLDAVTRGQTFKPPAPKFGRPLRGRCQTWRYACKKNPVARKCCHAKLECSFLVHARPRRRA